MEHLTKEKLELEAQKIAAILQSKNLESKKQLSDEEHKKMYAFLHGATYGVYLLMKYIERETTQPYDEFIKEEIEAIKKEVNIKQTST